MTPNYCICGDDADSSLPLNSTWRLRKKYIKVTCAASQQYPSSSFIQTPLPPPTSTSSTLQSKLSFHNKPTTFKMQFSIATVVALASVVLAVPSNIMERGNSICPEGTTNNNAVCCDTSVAGAANLNCDNST